MPPDLVPRLAAMFRDPAHDEVWRDYCVQHLSRLYGELESETDREQAREVFWAAVNAKNGNISGTALIALADRCGTSGFEKDRICAKALEMATSAEYGEPARITALQICATLGVAAVLPEARKRAAAGPAPIRMSAMACLGALGGESDLALLKQVESGTDSLLVNAAQAAAKRLNERFSR